jgi:hypothetical protein
MKYLGLSAGQFFVLMVLSNERGLRRIISQAYFSLIREASHEQSTSSSKKESSDASQMRTTAGLSGFTLQRQVRSSFLMW